MHSTLLEEVLVFTPGCFRDFRGDLWTLWNREDSPLDLDFNHDKVSVSKRNVLRGLHTDSKSWKLITCLHGEVQLVVVDYRKDSKNYLKSEYLILNNENKISVLIPPMFLNGHLVLSDSAVFHYKWSYKGEYPDVEDQLSVHYDCLDIPWLEKNVLLSARDSAASRL